MKSTLSLYSRISVRAILFIVLVPVCGLAGTQPMTFLDVLKLRSVSQGTLSKDGRMFAYTVSTLDWKSGKRFTDVWVTSTDGTPSRQLTFTPTQNENDPQFSAD